MHPDQMLQRAPHSPMAGTGWLHGWRLTFGGEDIGWEGALATVVEDPTSKVFVVLYDVTREDELNLDRWEGSELGFHKKIRCRVQRTASDTTFEPVLAWLYVVDAWEGGLPSARYLGVVADAAEIAGAPADYVHEPANPPGAQHRPGDQRRRLSSWRERQEPDASARVCTPIRRILRTVRGRSRRASEPKLLVDAPNELPRPLTDILEEDCE